MPGNRRFYGCYRPSHDEILLASPEESVLFHELAHAAHHKLLKEGLKNGQVWLQEVVAEFSATVLSYVCGRKPVNLGHHYKYMDDYARKVYKSAFKVCFEVIDELERVVNLILAATEEHQ